MESAENTTKSDNIINSHADVPDINNYLTPLSSVHINHIQNRIQSVLKNFKNKIDESSSIIIAKEEEISNSLKEEYSNIKKVDNYDNDLIGKSAKKKYNFILDCLSFIHRANESSEENNIKQIDRELLKHLISLINDKGVVVFLMDYQFL